MARPNPFTTHPISITVRCTSCGHVQQANGVQQQDGTRYLGSAAVWCDKCKRGKPEPIDPQSDSARLARPDVPSIATPVEVLQPPPLRTDTEILDWLERQHTLHRIVVATYVVDGYTVEIQHDYSTIPGAEWRGETLREAYSNAMAAWDLTHGAHNLLAERTIEA